MQLILDDDNDEAALDAEANAIADAVDYSIAKATFNGVSLLKILQWVNF